MNNKDDLEVHFHEKEDGDREEDCLVQMTFHFPPAGDEDEDAEGTPAEAMKQAIVDTGVLKSTTGAVIAEFSKDQGNFVTPRGKYGLQMTADYMHMQGAQYSYKIKYTDISSLYLLPKIDSGRDAFVIGLEKPIRQGNQKYQNLVLDTHQIEHTMSINLTEEQVRDKYEGQLSTEMTMKTSHLIAKVFKVLSKVPVFVSKHFVSARQHSAVRCSLGANEGQLYPLAKVRSPFACGCGCLLVGRMFLHLLSPPPPLLSPQTFIFINKPAIILKFDDIDSIEFKRYDQTANSAVRNFDLAVTMKSGGKGSGSKETTYSFNLIDRAEYKPLLDFFKSKNLPLHNAVDPSAAGRGRDALAGMDDGDDEDDDDEDDDDYEGGASDDDDDDDASGDDDDDDDDEDAGKKKRKAAPKKKSSSSSGDVLKKKAKAKKPRADDGDGDD